MSENKPTAAGVAPPAAGHLPRQLPPGTVRARWLLSVAPTPSLPDRATNTGAGVLSLQELLGVFKAERRAERRLRATLVSGALLLLFLLLLVGANAALTFAVVQLR